MFNVGDVIIINKSVRFILKVPQREHITPYLKKLHFLPLEFRIRYKLCLMAFKVFSELAPGYLTQHFERYQPSSDVNLRQVGRDSHMFVTTLQDYKKDNIFSGIKLEWNSLPLEIRTIQSLSVFKRNLKTEMFKNAFGLVTDI